MAPPIASASALNVKTWLDESLTEIQCGSRMVRVHGFPKKIPLSAFSKRLLELSRELPTSTAENSNFRERVTALYALDRIRILYKLSDKQLEETQCCFHALRCCMKRKENLIRTEIEKNSVESRLRGFTLAQFKKCFPERKTPLNSYIDGDIKEMLYLVEKNDLEILAKGDLPNQEEPRKSWLDKIFKKFSS